MAINETYIPFFWNIMSLEEKHQYYIDLGNRLLEHRYRYYIQDNPVLEDWIYDFIERMYKAVSSELNLKDIAIDMVDFDYTKPGAQEAANRVLEGVDHYSVNEERLKGIWKRIGSPRYIRKSEAK